MGRGTLAAVVLVVLLLLAAYAAEGRVTRLNPPPSGDYLRPSTLEVYRYDNASGTLTFTGTFATSLCLGIPEERVMAGGVCVDIDPTADASGKVGFSAKGLATLAGEWVVQSRIEVDGKSHNPCTPVCFVDAIVGVTYESWETGNPDVCKNKPTGTVLQALATMAALGHAGEVAFTASDTASILC